MWAISKSVNTFIFFFIFFIYLFFFLYRGPNNIFSDSNESEDTKKKLISKISVDSNFTFTRLVVVGLF